VATISDVVLAQNGEQARRLWALRENIGEAQKIEGLSIKHDVSVPISRIPEFVERAGQALALAFPEIRIVAFGHIGDGNLHYNQSKSEAGENAAFWPRNRRSTASSTIWCMHWEAASVPNTASGS
jgi:FAD/FMN-containing dehydrogenase